MAKWDTFAELMLGTWPGQVTSWGEDAIATYCGVLEARGVKPPDAEEAVLASTSVFPPSAGELAGRIQRIKQGPSPDWMTNSRLLAENIRLIDYHDPVASFDRYVAKLAEHHEATARFAVALGPRGCREMPDARFPQEVGGSTALTRLERAYGETRKEWEEDPTPGVALTEARRMAVEAGSDGRLEGRRFKELLGPDEEPADDVEGPEDPEASA